MVIAERSEFKGNPTIVLKRTADDKYPFSFGLAKAKMVLDAIAEIGQFVDDEEKAANENTGGGE